MIHLTSFITIIFICKIYAENANITDNQMAENIFQFNETIVNDTNKFNDSSLTLEDITQPMSFVLQEERQINDDNIKIRNSKKTSAVNVFKPSPQLEIQYEYNKFPVKPALPEAKHFSSNNGYSTNFLLTDENVLLSTEPPWISRIRFPDKTVSIKPQDVENQPYPFYFDNTKTSSSIKSSGNVSLM